MHYLSSHEKKTSLQKDEAENTYLIGVVSLDVTCRYRLSQPLTMPSRDAERYKSAHVVYGCLFLYWCLPTRQLASQTPPFLSWGRPGELTRVALSLHRCKAINILLPSPTCTEIIVGKKHLHKLSQSSNPALALDFALEGTLRPGFEICYIIWRMREKEQGYKKGP